MEKKSNQICQWMKKACDSIKGWAKEHKKMVVFMLLVALVLPPFLALFIFNASCFVCIPGGSDIWLGFWASYSGTLATIMVAFLSFEGNKKLEKVEKTFREKENEYISTLIGINIRLSKVYIIPQKAEKKVDGTVFSRYLMGFIFKNVSYAMIRSVKIREVTIGTSYTIEEGGKFFLEGDCPALEIEIPMLRGSDEEKRLSQFYFYYSQFGINRNRLDVKIIASIRIKNEDQENGSIEMKIEEQDPEVWIEMKLEMEPKKDESFISNKVKIVSYKINVKEKNKKG